MHPDAAALSSILTDLEHVTNRLASIAETHRADPDDPLTAPLDELERTLASASRRLERTVRNL